MTESATSSRLLHAVMQCELCQQIEEKIRRARKFAAADFDALTVERINQMIQNLERSKDAIQCRK